MKKLSFLIDSGLPFLQALHFIEEREVNTKVKKQLGIVIQKIHSGQAIHKSFDTEPLLIDRISLGVIESGEATGTLVQNCRQLSLELEHQLDNRSRIIGALVYPLCILFFAVGLISLLLIYIFPKLLPILTSGNKALPLSTTILLRTSTFLNEWWYAMVALFVILGILFWLLFSKMPKFRKSLEKVLLCVPLVANIIKLSKSSLFARQVSLYLRCGYPLFDCLKHISHTETNLIYKEVFDVIAKRVRNAERFSKTLLSESFYFSKELPQFAALGEESGNLSATFSHIALLFDEELKNIEKRMFSLLEPVLMLFLGLAVGFISLSLISPIYGLTSSFSASL